jgi:hypothetical protein
MSAAITQLRKSEPSAPVEILDAGELATRLKLPKSWIQEATRTRTVDVVPHLKFGRYIRFRWGSPELTAWIERRCIAGKR